MPKKMNNKKHYSKGFILPFFLKKDWFWFTDPKDVKNSAMVNFFSYKDFNITGFKKKEGLTTVIDLEQSLDDIWLKFRKKFIAKQIKRGERNSVIIKLSKDYNDFKKIYKKFREENNLGKEKLDLLFKNTFFIAAYYQNKMVAGGIFVNDEENMRALVLASLRGDGNREIIGQANRMLIWEIIKYAKNRGIKLFDLGGIAVNSEYRHQVTLAEFKEAFGGYRKKCYYYYKVYSPLLRFWIKIRK
jgi:lipid II:glycine glycyltransferase (peptidoglycan interpeptide bridge formation enzyme)